MPMHPRQILIACSSTIAFSFRTKPRMKEARDMIRRIFDMCFLKRDIDVT
jgi:hypothetical protein